GDPGSVQTQYSPSRNPPGFQVAIDPGPAHTGQSDILNQLDFPKERKRLWPFVVVGLLVVFLVLGVGAAIIFKPSLEAWLKTNSQPAEILPDHLGMFYQDNEKAVLNELKKFDSANIGDAANKLMSDDSITA